jgi:hypothetical protein
VCAGVWVHVYDTYMWGSRMSVGVYVSMRVGLSVYIIEYKHEVSIL